MLARRTGLAALLALCLPAAAWATDAPGAQAMLGHYAHAAGQHADLGRAWTDSKHGDVFVIYRLLERQPPDTVAVASGAWSDPVVWSTQAVPEPGSSVWVQENVRVVLAHRITGAGPKLLRIDGTLALATDADSRLAAGTVVVTHTGSLEAGSATEPVRADVEAEIVFTDRGRRDLATDPFDIGGGLLATGRLALHGAPKTGVAVPAEPLARASWRLRFAEAPSGWRVGDRLLVPGVSERQDQDEVVRIAALHADGREVELDRQLAYDHQGPEPGLVPVGNLSRNLVLRSAMAADARRGHVMVVHRAGGTEIDSVRFEALGRSRADAPATRPALTDRGLVPGSDANPLGRYMLHFHNQVGADLAHPHRVAHSVLEDGPRHGLVNHGDNVLAVDNVGFRIAGSHFFGENGAEIGAFTGNLAVRSAGSGEDLKSRMYTFDFGHGGHGFWAEGGGIGMEDNHAFGHAQAAFIVFSRRIAEPTRYAWFDRRNLRPELLAAAEWDEHIGVDKVPFVASGNVAAGSGAGFQVWYHKRSHQTRYQVFSRVEDSVFWGMRETPVTVNYAHRVAFRNVALFGNGSPARRAVSTNFETAHLRFTDMRIDGFDDGIVVPQKGMTRISGGSFANRRDIVVDSPLEWGRRVVVERTRSSSPQHLVLERRSFERDRDNPGYGYYSNLFQRDLVLLDGRQVFFADQAPDAVPLAGGPAALAGRTAAALWRDYGLAVGGALAGPDARPQAGIVGLVGDPAPRPPLPEPLYRQQTQGWRELAGYRLPDGSTGRVDLRGLDEGWQLVPLPVEGPPRMLLALVDRTAPLYELDPAFPTSICPADLAYGILVGGTLLDGSGKGRAAGKLRQIRTRYEVVDGKAVFPFELRDIAGNSRPASVALTIDAATPCRGPNIDHYLQAPVYSASDQIALK